MNEDWNQNRGLTVIFLAHLHPILQLDEDWNVEWEPKDSVDKELTSNLTIGWGLKRQCSPVHRRTQRLASNLTIGWGLKLHYGRNELAIDCTNIQFSNWMRIETSLKVEGTLIADIINQCKIDCGLKPIHRFTFSGSISFIQYINWMWIETHVFPPKL